MPNLTVGPPQCLFHEVSLIGSQEVNDLVTLSCLIGICHCCLIGYLVINLLAAKNYLLRYIVERIKYYPRFWIWFHDKMDGWWWMDRHDNIYSVLKCTQVQSLLPQMFQFRINFFYYLLCFLWAHNYNGEYHITWWPDIVMLCE
jgi:hypothetical protein